MRSPGGVAGPGPFMLADATAALCANPSSPCALAHGADTWWTDYLPDVACTEPGNTDAADVLAYMADMTSATIVLPGGCLIRGNDSGVFNNPISALVAIGLPHTFVVPLVDDGGAFLRWSNFVLTAAVPDGRGGALTGYVQ